MVIYAEKDDFGSVKGSKYSYYYGSNIEAIACCNITPFNVPDWVECEDCIPVNDRMLDDDDVEILTPKEYKEIFGVDYDPADWTLEAFTQ